jgi:hypothetical protein
MLLGPSVDQPALLPQRLLPAHVVVAAKMLGVLHLVADIGRQVGAHEGPHLVGEFAFFRRESEVHGTLPGGVLIGPEFSGEAASDKRTRTGSRLVTPRRGTN